MIKSRCYRFGILAWNYSCCFRLRRSRDFFVNSRIKILNFGKFIFRDEKFTEISFLLFCWHMKSLSFFSFFSSSFCALKFRRFYVVIFGLKIRNLTRQSMKHNLLNIQTASMQLTTVRTYLWWWEKKSGTVRCCLPHQLVNSGAI